MSREKQREKGQDMPHHPEENDIDLSIPAKRQRFAEEEEVKEEGMHYPMEIIAAGMDHKDFQIRQLNQKIASLESENMEMNGQIIQLRAQNQALAKSEALAQVEIAKLREQQDTCLRVDGENVTCIVKTDLKKCQKNLELKFVEIKSQLDEQAEKTSLSEIGINIPIKKIPYLWMRRTFARTLLTYSVEAGERLEVRIERKLILPLEMNYEILGWLKLPWLIPLLDPRWDAELNSEHLEILKDGRRIRSKKDVKCAQDKFKLTYSKSPFNAITARSVGFHALYYFEVEILELFDPTDVCIGFAAEKGEYSSRYIAFTPTGAMKCSPSYYWKDYGIDFKKGNVIGCGLVVPHKNKAINGKKAYAFLTINGIAFENILIDKNVEEVFPFAGLLCRGSMLETNFGQNPEKPFKYNFFIY